MGSLRFSAKVGFLDRPSLASLKTLRHPASPASARGYSTLASDARHSQTGRYVKSQIKSNVKSGKQHQKPKCRSWALPIPLRHPRAGGDPVFPNPFSEEKEHRSLHACQQKTLARMARMGKNGGFCE
jgi:hypothetical protein